MRTAGEQDVRRMRDENVVSAFWHLRQVEERDQGALKFWGFFL